MAAAGAGSPAAAPTGAGPAAPPARRRLRAKQALLAAFVALHLVVSLFFVVPGYLSVDEGTYHLMASNAAAGRWVEIWNGYRELPSPELRAGALMEKQGRLVAAPAQLFAYLAAPFHAALGYRGLFLLEALAFLGVLAAAWGLARRLFADPEVALDACLVLALATFLWDYSQAAWPHAVATLFVTGAAWCLAGALTARAPGRAVAWALACGLVAGLGPGLRMDAAMAIPALLLPPLFARPPRWRIAGAVAAGLVPGLALLSAVNRAKFGTWNPLSYGKTDDSVSSGVGPYLALVALALVAVAAAWLLSREGVLRRLGPVAPAVALVALGVVVLVVPAARHLVVRLADGAWQLLVDFRGRPDLPEPALARSPGGGLVYLGALKKSLLQSCPYLAILVVPALAAWRDRALAWRVALLAVVPAAYVAPYALHAWHGGLALNLRYFTPLLPFTSVLTAVALARLRPPPEAWSGARRAAGPLAGVAVALFYLLVLRPAFPTLAQQELVYLTFPLLLALGALLAGAAGELLAHSRALRSLAAVFVALGVTWAALVTFTHDAPRARRHRAENLAVAQALAPHVAEDSILFVPYPDPYFGLIDKPGVRLAVPSRDQFADFRRLVDHHLAAGRPVYAVFPPELWQALGRDGRLAGLELRLEQPELGLARIRRAGAGAAGEAP
ncbi:MAG TPA: hypothetical protein VHQ65_04055 [Thermoanaerobaculia bacterium]|nr:hypothetical protein [Thermoanaerobaculia bacterium]